MDLRKNGDNELLCTLTQEDLQKRGISPEDLAYSTIAARRLFVEILDEARQKLNYTIESGQYRAEIIPMGGGSFQLLLSPVASQDELDSRFANFRPTVMASGEDDATPVRRQDDGGVSAALRSMMNQSQDARGRSTEGQDPLASKSASAADSASRDRVEPAPGSAESRRRFVRLNRMFVFESLSRACEAAASTRAFRGKSALYRSPDSGTYRLLLTMPDLTSLRANQKVLITLSEYASQEVVTPSRLQSLNEHGELLIPEHAIERLSEI